MNHHNARARNWGNDVTTDWRGDCADCGWIAGSGRQTPKRPARTEVQAQRQAEKHNVEATARDAEIFQRMFGHRSQGA
jgi:hypothetical protein